MPHRNTFVATCAARRGMNWAATAMLSIGVAFAVAAHSQAAPQTGAPHPIVLHAARLLEVDTGRVISPGEILVEGERIAAVGSAVSRPTDA